MVVANTNLSVGGCQDVSLLKFLFAFFLLLFILDIYQSQALGWSGYSGFLPVLCFQNIFNLLGSVESPPDAQECSCDNPDHIVEKSVSPDQDYNFSAFFYTTGVF